MNEGKDGIKEGRLSNIRRICWVRQDAGRIYCMQRDRAAEGRKEEKSGVEGCMYGVKKA